MPEAIESPAANLTKEEEPVSPPSKSVNPVAVDDEDDFLDEPTWISDSSTPPKSI